MIRVFIAVLLVAPLAASATTTSALVNKALDSQQNLTLDATLPEAMRQIADQTGVRIEADPAVWDLLPWGEQTNLTVKVQNHTLREELTAITAKLGLEYVLTDEAIELRPVPALERLGRRATLREMELIALCRSTPLDLDADRPTVADVLATVDRRLKEARSDFVVADRATEAARSATISIPRRSTLADALEAISTRTDSTWYPWGTSVAVVSKADGVRSRLGRTISVRYVGADVSQVLTELSQRAGTRFIVDPGAYQKIPTPYRGITLTIENGTVQQSLDAIGGYTGLGFEATADGVRVTNAYVPADPPTSQPGH